ncbi:MAG: D-cysteine desulfhydrase family protein [Proteobacteria bacterium]|nr:D-cysteine desulfhydrase family protein [Pseudomonadota bacterium]
MTIEFLERHPRVALIHAPTPLEFLGGLSRRYGASIYIKRDDCTGLALGGNKSRKLEYVLAEALAMGADTVLTGGGLQSNHARQTAAACAKLGLKCILALKRSEAVCKDERDRNGNLLLDLLLGAETRRIDAAVELDAALAAIAGEVSAAGGRPYVIPLGASTALGALGYVCCAAEIVAQAQGLGLKPTHVFVASGSGGTQAGLMAGFEALGADIATLGVDIDANPQRTRQRVGDVLANTRELLGLPGPSQDQGRLRMLTGFAGQAYGEPADAGNAAIRQLAGGDGILLDPIYTGKAMSALIAMLEHREFQRTDCIVFVHTGGVPGLFAYHRAFTTDDAQ